MHLINNTMDNKHKRWEKSQTSDGMTKKICVEQVENGFIITMEKYGQSGEDEKYTNECKKYISKTNPLKEEDVKTEDESAEDKILDGLENLNF